MGELRPASSLDWRAFASLLHEAFRDVPGGRTDRATLAWYCRDVGHALEVLDADADPRAAAPLCASLRPRLAGAVVVLPRPNEGCAWLEVLAVASHARGRGLGHRLLSHAEARAATLGFARLELNVDARNHPALSLYERRGYRRLAESGHGVRYGRELPTPVPTSLPPPRDPPTTAQRFTRKVLFRLLRVGELAPS